MRKDAEQRRDRIIASAARMFQDHGYDVPLEDIAEHAGVGRGTLYRNFADRRELAMAVLEREVERLEQLSLALAGDPEGLFRLIRALADAMAVNLRLARAVQAAEQLDPFLELAARRDRAVEPPLQRAIAAGQVRPDFSINDVSRAATMIAAPAEFSRPPDRGAEIDRSLALLLAGIRPR